MSESHTHHLKVAVKDGKSCEKILTIEVGEEEISQEYDKFYRSIQSKAKIPGFRPGKAPRNILENHYAGQAKEEVLKNLVSHAYGHAIQDKEIRPLGYPEVSDVEFDDKKLKFKAVVEIRPQIKLSKVQGLQAKREKIDVKEEEIDESVNRIRDTLAQFKVVEDRASQIGDFVIADYVCTVDGEEVDRRNDDWLELKEDEFLKGFSAQLSGLKGGEEKEATVTLPDNFSRKEMAGKSAVFQVKVKEVKIKVLPELNDDFAKDAGEYETLAQLREKAAEDIKQQKSHQVEANYEKSLLDDLLKNNKVTLPVRLVRKRFDHLMEDAKNRLVSQGMPETEFDKQKEKMEKDVQSEAERQVHLAFLLDEIAENEKLEVGEEDIQKKFESMAERFRQPVDVIKKYYLEHEEAVDGLHDQIRNEKTIDYLKANAKS